MCMIGIVCVVHHVVLFVIHDISFHARSWHHSNTCIHSCILVTQPSESEPVEPTEVAEIEPDVEFQVEPEANQDKQLSMIPCTHLI